MDLGAKLLNARLEAGLSQRALCGDQITRNMLSQIENGTASPSMKTLRYLAQRLDKPLSYFLDENPTYSNMAITEELLDKAREALAQGKDLYAKELLSKATPTRECQIRQKLLLMARIPGENLTPICRALPSLDEELLIRAREALIDGEFFRAGHLLEAAENKDTLDWNLLRGHVWICIGEYGPAAASFHRAEGLGAEVASYLEECYREMGDYKRAYEYACAQKQRKP